MTAEKRIDKIFDKLIIKDTLYSPLYPNSIFKKRTTHLFLGKPGSGKTFRALREIVKSVELGSVNVVFIVSNTLGDKTLEAILPKINCKVFHSTYDTFEELFEMYQQAANALSDQEYEQLLGVPKTVKAEGVILFEDAIGQFQKTHTYFSKLLYKTRHLNCTVFIMVQLFTGIHHQLKSILSTITIYKKYSKTVLKMIYRQVPIPSPYPEFEAKNMKLKNFDSLTYQLQ